MTTLMQRMREDLVRRNYAESTIRSYLHTLEDFRRYAQKRLDHLGPGDIRRYQVYLREERKLDIGTASNYVAALRFFYVKTLKRPSVNEDLPCWPSMVSASLSAGKITRTATSKGR